MKICADHWNQLRKAIQDRGMGHLVQRSADEAVAALERKARGLPERPEDFDPLMGANLAIWKAGLDYGGMRMLTEADLCPLCEGEKQLPGLAQDWIDGSCNDELAKARAFGLVPTVQ